MDDGGKSHLLGLWAKAVDTVTNEKMDSVSISSLGSVHEAVGELRRRLTKRQLAKICVQFVHFLVALGFLIVALVEFSAERPLFDVLGKHSDIPDTVYSLFQVIVCLSVCNFTQTYYVVYVHTALCNL